MKHHTNRQFLSIRDSLADQIAGGLLPVGDKLPSERRLSELYETTRITVKEALLVLEAEGKIYREERRGWFVSPPRLIYNPMTKSHFHEMVQGQKRRAVTSVLAAATVPAQADMCKQMDLPPFTRVHHIRRQRCLDGRAALYVEHVVCAQRFPDLLEQDLTQSITGLYESRYGVRYGRSRFTITPTAAMGHIADMLSIADGSSILHIARVNYDQHGKLIDCDMEYWRHDAIQIAVDTDSWQEL
ncbi:UTRA domain-containing protein [Desulfobaculum senezii]|jgi:DNA-binding GntR family transcriptional regulator